MTEDLGDVFVDTAFWIALVVKQDQYHERAKAWSARIKGKIVTSVAVLFETANALARPVTRDSCVALIDSLHQRKNVEITPLSTHLHERAWDLFRARKDKNWSLTDCSSFLVMEDLGLSDALTSDIHFRQAGFRVVLSEQP